MSTSNKINVSFSGCGFLGLFHVGSLSAWQSHSDVIRVDRALGSSAGALISAALLTEIPSDVIRDKFFALADVAESLPFGPFNPKFDVNKIFARELDEILPPTAHEIADERLYISVTDPSFMRNVIIHNYDCRQDLIDALICSCFMPAFSAYAVPQFRGKSYLDGGFSNNQPVLNDPKGSPTVRISPFAGESDICPIDGKNRKKRIMVKKFLGERIEVSRQNMKRLLDAITPAKDLEALYNSGYQLTEEFIQDGRYLNFTTD